MKRQANEGQYINRPGSPEIFHVSTLRNIERKSILVIKRKKKPHFLKAKKTSNQFFPFSFVGFQPNNNHYLLTSNLFHPKHQTNPFFFFIYLSFPLLVVLISFSNQHATNPHYKKHDLLQATHIMARDHLHSQPTTNNLANILLQSKPKQNSSKIHSKLHLKQPKIIPKETLTPQTPNLLFSCLSSNI